MEISERGRVGSTTVDRKGEGKKQDLVGEEVELQYISVEVLVNTLECSVVEINIWTSPKLGEGLDI